MLDTHNTLYIQRWVECYYNFIIYSGVLAFCATYGWREQTFTHVCITMSRAESKSAGKGKGEGLVFIIDYCSSWDGGGQERNTAVEAVKRVYPKATFKCQVVRVYPNTVTVAIMEGDHKVNLWSSSQRNLYRKYGVKRTQSMNEIEAAVRGYTPSKKK